MPTPQRTLLEKLNVGESKDQEMAVGSAKHDTETKEQESENGGIR